jgi:chromosome segregation ATPase
MPRGQTGLSLERLKDMARSGAEATLKQLRAEIAAIERTFPELASGGKRLRRSFKATEKRARTMSATARKAVSKRMKKYWAERKKAQTKVT